jgi:thiamine kinase-like enzyme
MPLPPTPICYNAAYDPASGDYHLLLEDVSETHHTIHPEEPAKSSDLDGMLAALARLHAFWWSHPQLGQQVDTLPTAEAIRTSFTQLEQAFPSYVEYLGDRLSVERRRIYERVLERYPGVLTRRLAQHQTLTLVHEDAHTGNFLLPRHASEQRVYLIDW